MKIELAANDLAAALTRIKGAVPGRTTMPILETVLFEAAPGEVRVTASQVTTEATASVPCEVAETGRACIAASIIPIIKGLGKAPITLTVPEEPNARATVDGKRQRYEFATLPAIDFPVLQAEETVAFEIEAAKLRAAFAATAATVCSKSEHLAGVNISRDGGQLVFIATDRNRMTRYTMALPVGAEAFDTRHTIPHHTMTAISALIVGATSPVRVGLDLHSISVEVDGARLVSRLIGIDFMRREELARFLEEMGEFEVGFSAAKTEVGEALARIGTLLDEKKAPGVVFSAGPNGLKLASDRRGRDEGLEHIDAEAMAPTEFGVSASWITRLIGVWPDNAELHFAAPFPGKPIRITSPNCPELMQLCGPMKIFQRGEASHGSD